MFWDLFLEQSFDVRWCVVGVVDVSAVVGTTLRAAAALGQGAHSVALVLVGRQRRRQQRQGQSASVDPPAPSSR